MALLVLCSSLWRARLVKVSVTDSLENKTCQVTNSLFCCFVHIPSGSENEYSLFTSFVTVNFPMRIFSFPFAERKLARHPHSSCNRALVLETSRLSQKLQPVTPAEHKRVVLKQKTEKWIQRNIAVDLRDCWLGISRWKANEKNNYPTLHSLSWTLPRPSSSPEKLLCTSQMTERSTTHVASSDPRCKK